METSSESRLCRGAIRYLTLPAISFLRSKAVQAPIDGFTTVLPEAAPAKGLFVVDTKELFSALEGESFASQSKLERVCRLLGFKPEYLHNAGNDAHVRAPSLKRPR